MSDKRKINLTSLNLVRDELVTTIEQAATQLEGFVANREDDKLLDSCVESLKQIRGSLKLVEIHGASELAGELLHTASTINEGDKSREDQRLSALTRGFFILSCYFEYAQRHQQGLPVLLVPYINDIRIANRSPILPESFFVDGFIPFKLSDDPVMPPATGESLNGLARRARHMYQIGLIGVIKELKLEASFQIMQRAVARLYDFTKGTKNQTFWWLLFHCLTLFKEGKLSVNVERKRLLGQLDAEFKEVEKSGDRAFAKETVTDLVKELAYYITLTNEQRDPFGTIKVSFGFGGLDYTEADYLEQARDLTGPSNSTVLSVAQTLKEELAVAKEIIETGSESSGGHIDSYDELVSSVTKIKDILSVIGLGTVSASLEEQLHKIRSWQETGEEVEKGELIAVVDTFLYIESVLTSIEQGQFSGDQVDKLNQQSRDKLMMRSKLEEAHLVLLEEVESGLGMIKRALTSFTDSGYDRAHIKNIAKTLTGLRGGLQVLELNRAVAVVEGATRFVEGSLLSNNQPAAIQHMLETFADALISLEYYLDCLKVDKNTNTDTLVIAEESLSALGYGVNFQE